jgi:uncharacterized protein (DUF983 family)
MLWRGARRRCPWCGGRGAFFTSWFRKAETCRTCGIGWRRGYEGFELGAVAVSVIVVFGALVAAMAVVVAASAPDVPMFGLLVILVVVAVVLPVVIYPISYTLWQAVDLAMRPPDSADPAIPAPRP